MRRFLKNLRKEKGFTLVEMLVVLVIIAALLLLIIPNIGKATGNIGSVTNDGVQSTVESQAVLYQMDNDGSVPTLEQLKDAEYINENQAEAYKNLEVPDKKIK